MLYFASKIYDTAKQESYIQKWPLLTLSKNKSMLKRLGHVKASVLVGIYYGSSKFGYHIIDLCIVVT